MNRPASAPAFILGAALILGSFAGIIAGLNGGLQQQLARPAVATPAMAPIELATPPLDPVAVLAGFRETGVAIVRTDDAALNCGLTLGPIGGCFRPESPRVIYLSISASNAVLLYLTLHEYRHFQQHRDGRPLDECDADRWAVEHGADARIARYLPECGS